MSKASVYRSLFYLFLFVASVTAVGPAVTSFEYNIKSYQTLEERNQLAVLTATFDQDLFVQLQCNDSKPDTVVAPCCSESQQTQCFVDLTTNTCIDSSNPYRGSLRRSESQYFSFKVSNPSDCNVLTILVRAITGDPDLFISITNKTTTTPDATSRFRSENIGSDSFTFCCSTVTEQPNNPTWNGTLYFTVFASVDTTFEVTILTTSRLNATDSYTTPQMQVDCNGDTVLTPEDCATIACVPLPPTPDPLFSYIASASGLPVLFDYQLQRLSIALFLKRETFTSITTSTTRLPFNSAFLSDSTCTYSFPNLVNAAGEPVSASLPLSRTELQCSQARFREAVEGINSVIEALRSSSPDNLAVVTDFVQQSAAYVVTDAWVGCIDLVENRLLGQEFRQQTINNTASCFVTDPFSEEYLSDPCCNPDLQLQMCCAPRSISTPVASFAVNVDALGSTCASSRCAEPVLNDYIVLAEAAGTLDTGCAQESIRALNDPFFVTNPLVECQRAVFQQSCDDAGPCPSLTGAADSQCVMQGWCTVPCETNEDCLTGNCTLVAQLKTCELVDPFGPILAAGNRLLVECLNQNTNQFVNLFLRQELGLNSSSSDEEFTDRLFEDLSEFTCTGTIGTIPTSHLTNQTLCEGTRACNYVTCTDLDPSGTCTEENCNDPVITENDSFCLACLSKTNCFEISVFAHCEYSSWDGQSGCEAVGGHFNPIAGVATISEVCWRASNSSETTCFPPNLCPVVIEQRCQPSCYFPGVNESDCSGTMDGRTVEWRGNADGDGACVVSGSVGQQTCVGPNMQWWPGTFQWQGALNSSAECTSVGYCPQKLNFATEAECLLEENYYCQGCPVCKTQALCESLGECNDRPNCHLPFNQEGECSVPSDVWTPNGCFRESLGSQSTCLTAGGTWIPSANTKAECDSKGFVCSLPQTAGLIVQKRQNERPAGISFKNSTECSLCSGEYKPFYTWTPYRWIQSRFIPGQWLKREWIQAHSWTGSVNVNRFEDLHTRSAARRYANIVQSNILCRYGKSSQVIDQLSCDCGVDGAQEACFGTLSRQVVQVVQMCNNIAATVQLPLGLLRSTSDIAINGSDCGEISVAVVPVAQFNQRRQVSLSSVSVSLSQAGRVDQVRFLKNRFGVAIGELIGDGIEFSPNQQILGGLTVCLTIPDTWNSSLPAAYFDVAYPLDANYTTFALLGLALDLDAKELCVDFFSTNNEDLIAFFPVILIQDYDNASFIQGLFPAEIFIIFFGVLIYALTTAFTLFHFGKHVAAWIQGGKSRSFLSLSRVALMVLALVLLIRLVFLLLLPFGILEQYKPVDVIFSELPALLFCCIYSIIVLRWAEIYHFSMSGAKPGFSKLKPAVVALIIFLGVAFIVLLVLFLAILAPTIRVDCSTPEELIDAITSTEIVAIVYKVFFAAICMTLSALFILYGARIVLLMRQGQAQSDKNKLMKRKRTMYRLMIISGVSAVCLLAQAANLLWSSFDQSRNIYGVLVFLYVIEIAPAIIFILMFKRGSLFSRYNRKDATNNNSTSGQGSTASGNTTAGGTRTRMTSLGQSELDRSDVLDKSDVLDRSEVADRSEVVDESE